MPGTYISPAETGLYYLLSRYYDPMTMRFVNADKILGINQDMAAYNLFVYCGNQPVNRSDIGGYSWWDDFKSGVSNAWNSFTGWLGDTFGVQTTTTVVNRETKNEVNLIFAKIIETDSISYEITKGESKPITAYADTTNKKVGIKAKAGNISGNIGMGFDGILSEKVSYSQQNTSYSFGFKEKVITSDYSFSMSDGNYSKSYSLEINKLNVALAVVAPYLIPFSNSSTIVEIFN